MFPTLNFWLFVLLIMLTSSACSNEINTQKLENKPFVVHKKTMQAKDSAQILNDSLGSLRLKEDSALTEHVISSNQPLQLEQHISQIDSIVSLCDKLAENTLLNSLAENIKVDTFMSQTIDFTALSTQQLNEQMMITTLDLFAESMVGFKKFYTQNDSLIYLEVFMLEEIVSENGRQICEQFKYRYYYHHLQRLDTIAVPLQYDALKTNDPDLTQWLNIKQIINAYD